VTKATIAPEIHQALDAHRHFATQVALDTKPANLVAQTLQFSLGQVFIFVERVTPAASQIFCARGRPIP
jgi:hypothetical protein